jgi:hypothetical protein
LRKESAEQGELGRLNAIKDIQKQRLQAKIKVPEWTKIMIEK